MCFCFPFGLSSNKKRKSSSSSSTSGEKKRRDRPPEDRLRGDGRKVVADSGEGRSSSEKQKRRSGGSSRREREEPQQQYYQASNPAYTTSKPPHRAPLHVEVPNKWYRPVEPESTNSSQEMLLNPRPHRSPHTRQKHPKRTSQTTLRGHGKRVKSKKSVRDTPSGWSLFAPPPPKTPKRREHYQPLESSPRSHRSSRQHRSSHQQDSPDSSRSDHRRRRSDQRQPSSHRQATPNTAARRVPDRRFAVLAATNTALEDVRREAFAQPSPPPRRERLRRYQGVTLPASSIPYTWDCVSSQTSAGYAESSSRNRRRR